MSDVGVVKTTSDFQAALAQQQAQRRRSKVIVIASVVCLVVLIVVGVTVGVVVGKKSHNDNLVKTGTGNLQDDKNSTTSSSSGPKHKNANGNDPSVFALDPRLHKSFYGMAYTPEGSLMPNCGNTLEGVIKDVQLLSQLTTRLRLYGSDCNQSALVLEAIKRTKVDVQVFLGNYIVDGDTAANDRQTEAIKSAVQTYGTDHVAGITVGNEYMLNYVTQHGESGPDTPGASVGAQILLTNIKNTRTMLAGLSMSKTIPVGNSDAGSYFNTEVLSSVDYAMSNVHAWFANTSAENAAAWVSSFFQDTNLNRTASLPNHPKMYIAETGWPTGSKDVGSLTNGPGNASVAGLQVFLDTFICQANQNGTGYFFFELFDEQWKDAKYGGVEGHWGLFNSDRSLKGLKIPDCPAP